MGDGGAFRYRKFTKRGILFGGRGKDRSGTGCGKDGVERLGVEGSATWRKKVGGGWPWRKNTSQKRAKCAFSGPLEEKLKGLFLLARIYVFTGS